MDIKFNFGYWFLIPILILAILHIGQTKISLHPFYFQMKSPYMAVGILLLACSMSCIWMAGFKSAEISKEDLMELLKDIDSDKLKEAIENTEEVKEI